MAFSAEEINDFKIEAFELLEAAEEALLAIEGGAPYPKHYDALFRAFHSVKGAAGMMEMNALQAFVHGLETSLVSVKNEATLSKPQIEYFLSGCDSTKALLDKGVEAELPAFPVHSVAKSLSPATELIAEPVPIPLNLRDERDRGLPAGKVAFLRTGGNLNPHIVDVVRDAKYEIRFFGEIDVLVSQIKSAAVEAVFMDADPTQDDTRRNVALLKHYDPHLSVINTKRDVGLQSSLESGFFYHFGEGADDDSIRELTRKAVRANRLYRFVDEALSVLKKHYSSVDMQLKSAALPVEREQMKSDVLQLIEMKNALKKKAA